jgi:lipid A 3-O-deacylase
MRPESRANAFASTLGLLGLLVVTFAADAAGSYLSVVSENDLYVDGRDRHYTAGTQLTYGFAEGQAPDWLSWIAALSPLDRGVEAREVNLAIGQVITTPEDLSLASPPLDDRRYGGWLFGLLSATTHAPGMEDEVGIALGMLGPASLAEDAHKFLHDITPSIDPQGWDTQLDDEPALLVQLRRSWFVPVKPDDVWRGDLVPRLQLMLGNVLTEVDAGLGWRFGSAVYERDQPTRLLIGGTTAAPRFDVRPGRIDWMFRADVTGRAVFHNVFIDGSLFEQDFRDLESKTLTWDASAGMFITFGNLPRPAALSFTYTWRAREFEEQRGINRFGAINLAVQF